MSDLEVYNLGRWSVRTEIRDGEPWFVARDVCAALDLDNVSMAIARLDDDEKGVSQIDTPGGRQTMSVINEAGLYSLILRSDKPVAKQFKRWVTHEVLPMIRTTGSYAHPSMQPAPFELPATFGEALRMLANTVDKNERLAVELAAAAPKVATHDAVLAADGDVSIREAAQTLSRDPAIKLGQNRLMVFLREIEWVDRNGNPYQRHVERGVLAVRVRSYDHPHTGEPRVSTQIRITPRGVAELHRRLTTPKQQALKLVHGGQG